MTHKFQVKGRTIEVFFAKDGQVEIYESMNPTKTGFILENIRALNMFINGLTDIAEQHQKE